MGELDQVSQAIGELKGMMVGHGIELKAIKDDVGQIKTQYIELNKDGCAKGKSNSGKIDELKFTVAHVESGRLSGKDLVKMLGGATGITAIFTAVAEYVRHTAGK